MNFGTNSKEINMFLLGKKHEIVPNKLAADGTVTNKSF